MNQPPLNPDALEAASCEVFREVLRFTKTQSARVARRAVSAYLTAAQPVVNSVEELDQLPVGSLIMMRGVVAPFLHTDDGWESTRTPGKPVWDYTTNPSYLPARVLHRPVVES